ncbi:hypothetical protein ACM66B_003688 [Microbotryomycetes sp. NB124-2]
MSAFASGIAAPQPRPKPLHLTMSARQSAKKTPLDDPAALDMFGDGHRSDASTSERLPTDAHQSFETASAQASSGNASDETQSAHSCPRSSDDSTSGSRDQFNSVSTSRRTIYFDATDADHFGTHVKAAAVQLEESSAHPVLELDEHATNAIALFDFRGEESFGELSFNANQRFVIEKADLGASWSLGYLQDRGEHSRGLIPQHFYVSLPIENGHQASDILFQSTVRDHDAAQQMTTPSSAGVAKEHARTEAPAPNALDDSDSGQRTSHKHKLTSSSSVLRDQLFPMRDELGINRSLTLKEILAQHKQHTSPQASNNHLHQPIITPDTARDPEHPVLKWIRSRPSSVVEPPIHRDVEIGEGPEYVNDAPFKTTVARFRVSENGDFVEYEIATCFEPDEEASGQKMRVFRRYSNFVRLQSSLSAFFLLSQTYQLPPKSFGLNTDDDFLETRRRLLARWLESVTSHPVLRASEQVRAFLSCQDEQDLNVALGDSKDFGLDGVFHPDFNIDVEEAHSLLQRFRARFDQVEASARHARADKAMFQLRQQLADLDASTASCVGVLTELESRVAPPGSAAPTRHEADRSADILFEAHERICDLSCSLVVAQNLIHVASLVFAEHERLDQLETDGSDALGRCDTAVNVVCAEMNHLLRKYNEDVATIQSLTYDGLKVYHQTVSLD